MAKIRIRDSPIIIWHFLGTNNIVANCTNIQLLTLPSLCYDKSHCPRLFDQKIYEPFLIINLFFLICYSTWYYIFKLEAVSEVDSLGGRSPLFHLFHYEERKFFYISLKKLWDSGIMWLRYFSFFLSGTFVYEPILFKISMNANIVKTQFFIKSSTTLKVFQGHKQWPFYLKIHFSSVYVIDWLKKQMLLNIMNEQSLTYTKTTFVLTLTYVLMDNFLSLFLSTSTNPYFSTTKVYWIKKWV